MDMTLAVPFATIVSLIARFESGRTGKATYQEFKGWLEKNHQEFVNFITENNRIIGEIEKIIQTDHAQLDKIFRKLDDFLASTASSIDETKGLAKAVKQNSQISVQSVNILKQLVDSKGSKFIKRNGFMGELELLISDKEVYEANDYIDISEKRFLIDDLNTLVEYGFLIHKKREDVYIITRKGEDFIKLHRH